jgi:hypothetical protein
VQNFLQNILVLIVSKKTYLTQNNTFVRKRIFRTVIVRYGLLIKVVPHNNTLNINKLNSKKENTYFCVVNIV